MTETFHTANLLQQLVRIPSPNPPGDTAAIAMYVADWLRQRGCKIRPLAPPEKPEAVNVIATVGSGDPVILLHAHIDTVPIAANEAEKWDCDPYAALIKDNKLYGKGSVDDKAPLAAMMLSMEHVAQHQDRLNGTLILVAAAEEEVGGQLGTKWLADNGHLPTCDFIVVGEQTHNRVANAHKGVVRATIRAIGKAAHATNPDNGINAITAMARVVLALQEYHESLRYRAHPTAGTATCNVGVIEGGSTANAVPDTCSIFLDRRMIPGEDSEVVKKELIEVVEQVDVAPAEVQIGDFLVSNWFGSTVESPLAQAFLDSVENVISASPGPIGYLPGSDAKHLTELLRGEMIIFGPGSYEVAHAYNEYVDIYELEETTQILLDFVDRTLLI
jgi:acetylornithine deacetylase/succinyl-diaminopimelate desuccinylase family protein